MSRCCEGVDRNRKAERELYLYVRRVKEESGDWSGGLKVACV